MFHITRRRRNVLLACTAVAVGGYASYRIYNSRKRLRVFLLLQSFSSLLDALSQGSDSVAVVVSDLRAFLSSDGDEVPRSLKQLLKLGGSHEVQESVTALSAAISRGVLTTLLNGGSVALSLKHHESDNVPGSSSPPSGVETKDVIRWGGGENIASIDDRALSPDEETLAEDNWRDCHEVWDENVMRTTSSASACDDLVEGVKSQVNSSLVKGAKEALQEGLGLGESFGHSGRSEEGRGAISSSSSNRDKYVDKLIEKLFSESGKGFVSAVVGSASRSFVVSFLEHVNMPNTASSSVGGKGDTTAAVLKGVAEFASNGEGRALLIDCIQTFVGTAVSVYVERTKDINAFDELVAGLVKSEYREPITDLLTTVCQATASSFVRASHEVLTADPSSTSRSTSTLNPRIPSLNPGGGSSSGYGNAVTSYDDVGEEEDVGSYGRQGNSGGFKKEELVQLDLIQGLSKALAVPSNRKLILEIAGTMTTLGVRSAIDVSLGKLSTALKGGKGKEHAVKALEHETPKQTLVGEKLQMVGDMTKSAIDKSMVLMTMCIAVCFHSVTGGVRMIQPF